MVPINQADPPIQLIENPLPNDAVPQPVILKVRPSTTLKIRPEYCTPFNHLFEDIICTKTSTGMGSLAVANYYFKQEQARKEE